LRNGEDGVTDVVVERAFMKFARKKVVAAGVEGFFAVAAGGWGWLVEEGGAEFAMEQELVSVRVESVVGEATGQRVQWNAGGWGKERGEDVLGGSWEGGHGSEEDLGPVVMVDAAGEAL
jgi:hypothetical protein